MDAMLSAIEARLENFEPPLGIVFHELSPIHQLQLLHDYAVRSLRDAKSSLVTTRRQMTFTPIPDDDTRFTHALVKREVELTARIGQLGDLVSLLDDFVGDLAALEETPLCDTESERGQSESESDPMDWPSTPNTPPPMCPTYPRPLYLDPAATSSTPSSSYPSSPRSSSMFPPSSPRSSSMYYPHHRRHHSGHSNHSGRSHSRHRRQPSSPRSPRSPTLLPPPYPSMELLSRTPSRNHGHGHGHGASSGSSTGSSTGSSAWPLPASAPPEYRMRHSIRYSTASAGAAPGVGPGVPGLRATQGQGRDMDAGGAFSGDEARLSRSWSRRSARSCGGHTHHHHHRSWSRGRTPVRSSAALRTATATPLPSDDECERYSQHDDDLWVLSPAEYSDNDNDADDDDDDDNGPSAHRLRGRRAADDPEDAQPALGDDITVDAPKVRMHSLGLGAHGRIHAQLASTRLSLVFPPTFSVPADDAGDIGDADDEGDDAGGMSDASHAFEFDDMLRGLSSVPEAPAPADTTPTLNSIRADTNPFVYGFAYDSSSDSDSDIDSDAPSVPTPTAAIAGSHLPGQHPHNEDMWWWRHGATVLAH